MPEWMEMLRRMVGEDKAREIEEQIRSGSPFSAFGNGEGIFAFPLQSIMTSSNEAVNWELARMTATGRPQSSSAVLTAAQASQVREELSRANLRLDPVTSLRPPSADYAAWSASNWLDASQEVWKLLVTPVAEQTTQAMKSALSEHISDGDLQVEIMNGPDQLRQLMSMFSKDGDAAALNLDSLLEVLSANLFGLQFGQAWGSLAAESFGATDIGLPVGKPNQAALVMENIEKFAADISLEVEPVLTFLATREVAYIRLYYAVPWLRVHVIKAIGDYARDITFDLDAMEQAMHSISPLDPGSMQKLVQNGVLTPNMTGKQSAAQRSLETLLAIMEGWVDMVTVRCLSGVLPEIGSLREMMNRRRANGGPAEKAFAALIGLQLRPKRLREASALWSKLVAKLGEEGGEKLWEHPDLLPEESDFDNPEAFVERMTGESPKDEVETALEAMLDGSLGYAEGLKPGVDSQGDAEVSGEAAGNPPDSEDSGQPGDACDADDSGETDDSGDADDSGETPESR